MAFTLWRDRENRIVDPELFSTKAEEFAQQIDREGTSTINKRTQLRNFYDEIMRLNIQAQDNPDAWDLVLPQVHMVIAKAAYAKGRNLISDGFLARIREGIGQVETPGDLKVFTTHLEAFMGFYRLYSK